MSIGFYAGSFDPFTVGHLNIVKKASEIFDHVIIGIGHNSVKSGRYDKSDMLSAIKSTLKDNNINNCECVIYNGLTVSEAKKRGATYLIRGIRNGMDYATEENLAEINEEISGIDTIYLRAGRYGAVSSSMVCELLNNGIDVSKYLPKAVYELVQKNKL